MRSKKSLKLNYVPKTILNNYLSDNPLYFSYPFFYTLPNAPFLDTGAIASVYAAKSIIETGIPMRGELFYARDYLAHYLLAGSIFLVGDNHLGWALPNLIFSILVLILIYFIAQIVTNNKIVIFLTIIFVAISAIENAYAINPRSYMQFQFFFLLTVFCFYKGFVEKQCSCREQACLFPTTTILAKQKKYRILTLFSYLASILSHLSGMILMPIFGFYLILKNRNWYQDKLTIIIFTVIVLSSVFLICVKLPINNVPINPNRIIFDLPYNFQFKIPFLEKDPTNLAARTNEGPSGMSLNLTGYFPILFSYLPFLCLFIFAGIIKLVKNKNYKLVYFYYIFLFSFFLISLFTLHSVDKYIFCVFPIFTLLVFLEIADFIEFVIGKKNSKLIFLGWGIIIFSSFLFLLLPIREAYFPYSTYGFRSYFLNHRQAVAYLFENKKEGDIIISDDSTTYRFYLNQCDYYLKQRVIGIDHNDKKIWSSLDPQKQSPHIIDNLDKLKEVLENNQRIWLIRRKSTISPELTQYIENNSELKFTDCRVRIYFSGE